MCAASGYHGRAGPEVCFDSVIVGTFVERDREPGQRPCYSVIGFRFVFAHYASSSSAHDHQD